MHIYTHKSLAFDAVAFTFDEFVEFGKNSTSNIVNGMPWSFNFIDRPVTNENDEHYIISNRDAGIVNFTKKQMLLYDYILDDLYTIDSSALNHIYVRKYNQPYTICCALDLKGGIGIDNKLPWRQSADLKRFKRMTEYNSILMGRKTFESINKPLPNRLNLIVSKDTNIDVDYLNKLGNATCKTYASLDTCIQENVNNTTKLFVIGGASIYAQTLANATVLELTCIHDNVDGLDTFFAQFNIKDYLLLHASQIYPADDKNQYAYQFLTYIKK